MIDSFPEPWRDLRADSEARAGAEAELARELAPGHMLHGRPVRGLAICDGHCDDVLFELDDGSVAVVHLSYPTRGPDAPPFPHTVVLGSADELAAVMSGHLDP